MKHKLIALLLASTLMLSSCGTTDTTDTSNSGSSTDGSTSTTADVQMSESESSSEVITEAPTTTEEAKATFEELTVVDNDECTIKITKLDPNNFWGYTLKVFLENKSADKTYMFSVDNAAVNGVQCDPFFASEVAPSKKANTEITFSDSTLEENDITDFTDIELSFRVYDSNDWLADEVAETTVHVYPYGEANATHFIRESLPSDNIILDNESVTVTVIGYENNSIFGYTVNLFLVNKTDKNVMFSVDEASVNGYMADPFYAKTVSAGKCAFSSMSWSDSTFEENSITEVEVIEFLLRAYDEDDWFADDFANQVITLNP